VKIIKKYQFLLFAIFGELDIAAQKYVKIEKKRDFKVIYLAGPSKLLSFFD